MNRELLKNLFDQINVWKKGDQRAPHKPLLLLMALARVQRGEERLVVFDQVDDVLRKLLMDFGPSRRSYHPEYPFWRLQNDGDLWDIPERERCLDARGDAKRTGDIPAGILRDCGARGGFTAEAHALLQGDPALVNRLAEQILVNHFEPSMHEDLLDAVGFPWTPVPGRRDPEFRERIIRIYDHRCAVCGYDGKIGRTDLAIEAAHVKWHSAGGPDTDDNGLALCTLHHKVFDRGGIGIDEERRILVSQDVHGQTGTQELFFRHIGQPLRSPQSGQAPPAAVYIAWHRREVFREPPRAP